MSGDIAGDPDALHSDAKKWGQWREDLAQITGPLDQYLPDSAFSDVPGAQEVATAFHAAMTAFHEYTSKGTVALRATQDAVLHVTIDIMRQEDATAAAIAAIEAELG
jgi:hypothetical protein